MARILIVDDEPAIVMAVKDELLFEGYEVDMASDGPSALEKAHTFEPDVMLLDVMLPGMNGFEVCRQLRHERSDLWIIMLTVREHEVDRVRGLEQGADDYVTKPFSVSELLARVKALLRRAGSEQRTPVSSFAFGEWHIDAPALRATSGERCVDLSPREVQILALLAREAGRVVSRRLLLHEVWGFANPENIETRTVDMQIGKLRRKIDGESASLIETVRGAGYRYTGPRS